MTKRKLRFVIGPAKILAVGLAGAIVAMLAVGIYFLNQKPDLQIWHTADLDEEFSNGSTVKNFDDYLELEERLFTQLEKVIYDRTNRGGDAMELANRYHRGSRSDPFRWAQDWNRSYELEVDLPGRGPKVGVLLIHGLSDSPYSLRKIGANLNAAGAHILSLRVPGHGTVPAALTRTDWEEMAAAVELAMSHLAAQAPGKPLYVIGYSNGGALAVRYALSSIYDAELPALEGIVLLSPEIGVTRMAGLAKWQDRFGRILGLEKLAWNSVTPEYDPFKYSSFPVHAGNLAYELTGVNRADLMRLQSENRFDRFPRVLAFQSAIDATVAPSALVKDLFSRLQHDQDELVVFDINRSTGMELLFKHDPISEAAIIRDDPGRSFIFSVVTNAAPERDDVVERYSVPGRSNFQERDLNLSWPSGVFSLSHIALPFAEDDPLYGAQRSSSKNPVIHLGALALRGERGALKIPAEDMLRQRWNPFYPYLEEKIVGFLKLDSE